MTRFVERQVNLRRLSIGKRISSISAILLFAFTFFHWFGVKAVNTSPLLFDIKAVGPGKSAWEALDYIPIFLVIPTVVTLAVAVLHLVNVSRRPSIRSTQRLRSSASSRRC